MFLVKRSVARASVTSLIPRVTVGGSRTLFVSGRPLRINEFKPINQLPRHYSVLSQSVAKLFKYEDVKDLVKNPEKYPDSVLIDVREPMEYKDGHIPGALNVPFKSSPGALDMSEEEFEDSFGFKKPSKDQNLVFYCLGGVRSTAAEELANSFGYPNRANYVGSYEDWVANENKH